MSSRQVSVRLSDKQFTKIEAEARKAGVPMGTFIRNTLFSPGTDVTTLRTDIFGLKSDLGQIVQLLELNQETVLQLISLVYKRTPDPVLTKAEAEQKEAKAPAVVRALIERAAKELAEYYDAGGQDPFGEDIFRRMHNGNGKADV